MGKNIVHIVGTGTIGEPLIGLMSDYQAELGIDEITFHKNSPLLRERAKVNDLMSRGAKLAVDGDKIESFKEIDINPDLESEEAIKKATVVIDCTPKGIGHRNKHKYYDRFVKEGKGFLAQGSEHGFGMKYARGINDDALKKKGENFIQIVSCNTHNIAAITKTLALNRGEDTLEEGRFVCIRRSSDISQTSAFVPAPEVGKHSAENYGTHHARDAVELFQTVDYLPNLFSSAMRINSQYMHVIWFNIRLKEKVTLQDVIDRFAADPLIALTEKTSASTVFSFGRDHGHYGRILNQTVVAVPTLTVHNQNEVVGYCFTPQDGNSLLSSISATECFLHPNNWEKKINALAHLFFSEV